MTSMTLQRQVLFSAQPSFDPRGSPSLETLTGKSDISETGQISPTYYHAVRDDLFEKYIKCGYFAPDSAFLNGNGVVDLDLARIARLFTSSITPQALKLGYLDDAPARTTILVAESTKYVRWNAEEKRDIGWLVFNGGSNPVELRKAITTIITFNQGLYNELDLKLGVRNAASVPVLELPSDLRIECWPNTEQAQTEWRNAAINYLNGYFPSR